MATVHQFTRKSEPATLRCTSCGKTTDAACNCGAPYEYISPGKLAEQAIKTYPASMSSREIADKIGVAPDTVDRARKSTARNQADEKRTGRDGRTRRMPRKKSAPKRHARADDVVGRADANMSYKDIAADTDVSARQARHIVEEEQLRREAREEAFAELIGSVDFTKATAKQKLEAAIRAQVKRHERDYTTEFAKAVDANIKRIMPDLQERKNKAWEAEQLYRKFMDRQKKIFTPDQFKLISMCLHPDGERSQQKLTNAFLTFREKKFALTGES